MGTPVTIEEEADTVAEAASYFIELGASKAGDERRAILRRAECLVSLHARVRRDIKRGHPRPWISG